MYRNELKYVINASTAHILESKLKQLCDFDKNSDESGYYRVTSLYFDDFCNSALNDNIIGQMARKKYRIRIYDKKDSFIRLERKTKHNKGGIKEAAIISKKQYNNIIRGNYETLSQVDTALLRGFFMERSARKLEPKVIVDYNRQSFVYNHGMVRITLDHNVRYAINSMDLFDSKIVMVPAVDEKQIILEVKYTGFLPSHIKDMIQQSVTRQQGVSKYSLCRACGF